MKKGIVLAIIALAVIGYYTIPESYKSILSLQGLQAALESFRAYYVANPAFTLILFIGVYIISAALSLPFASLLTVLSGALFPLPVAILATLTGATIGALLAMLAARTLLKDFVNNRFKDRMAQMEKGFAQEGLFYLFALRLVPAFPFFMVNLVMGITPIKAVSFVWVSFVGMLPGTSAYVLAGQQFSQITSLQGIISPQMLGVFALLGLLPIALKKVLQILRSQKVYKKYTKPQSYDYNVITIGAGAGGLVSSYIGAAMGAKVALIEKNKMGGDCLNTGCVPSKALLHAAEQLYKANATLQKYGDNHRLDVRADNVQQKVLQHVRDSIKKISPHDSVQRYTSLGVSVYNAHATVLDPWTVELVDTEGAKSRITGKKIILATGAQPVVPPFAGLSDVPYRTSDTFWDLQKLPQRLLIVGGGPIGCELAQACARLGVQVSIIERAPRLFGREDYKVANILQNSLQEQGVTIHTGYSVERFIKDQNGFFVIAKNENGQELQVEFDEVLLALGRKARRGFGLEELGIKSTHTGTIAVNERLQTNYPNIYAVGDAAGPFQFTHFASHQAWYAAVNALLSPFWSFKVDYRVIPRVTYTYPQVARVGLNEEEAKIKGLEYEVTEYHLNELDRAITEEQNFGFVQVITPKGKDTVLGVTIVGEYAGELLAEWALAMKNKIGLKKILGTIHAYPTYAEANKSVAGAWMQKHRPLKALQLATKFFAWRIQ
jgi:pyruvate/2-oxoglutarate dehydrogenase complex dihydrolipoamide dehydrogenase (E3) component/uncharacterized membrane protein YdjX (TVP38/TMEM64 family)